jgi:hypothetical protein
MKVKQFRILVNSAVYNKLYLELKYAEAEKKRGKNIIFKLPHPYK